MFKRYWHPEITKKLKIPGIPGIPGIQISLPPLGS
jgi:hypothetical protein